MSRWLSLALALTFAPAVLGQGTDEAQAEALERTMQKAIKRGQPSIACILISRSSIYQQLSGQSPDNSGKLGDFPTLAEDIPSAERQRLRQIRSGGPGLSQEAFGSNVVIDQGPYPYQLSRHSRRHQVFVRLPDGKSSYADIHAADPRSDMAILKVRDANLLPLSAITLGDASKIQRGQFRSDARQSDHGGRVRQRTAKRLVGNCQQRAARRQPGDARRIAAGRCSIMARCSKPIPIRN